LFTLLAWCIFNSIFNVYLGLTVDGVLLTNKDFRVCGDDSVSRVFESNRSIEDYRRAAAEIGIECHPAPKSGLHYWPEATKIVTLSTNFSDPTVIERDEDDVFARMCYPSRWISSREESVARVMMLCLSVARTMVRVKEFCEWYYFWKPVNLYAPIFLDRDINKYFRYVVDVPWLRLPGSSRLLDLLPVYGNYFKWALMLFRM